MTYRCIGYHGTHSKNIDSILKNGYRLSGEKEWFGKGVYFFQDYFPITNGFKEAISWAIYVKGFRSIAIFKSLIISNKYFDLVENIEHKELFDKIRGDLLKLHKKSGKNIDDFKDCIVFEKLSEISDIDFIRAAVDAGRNFGYYSVVIRRFQVQICVKNLRCIKKNECIFNKRILF